MPTQQTTSQENPFLSEIRDGSDIPEAKLAYFRARLSNRIHEFLITTFQECEERHSLTKAKLAKRISRKPEQITRWFASAGNLEIGTVSDLLLGMGYEPDFSRVDLRGQASSPESDEIAGIDWLMNQRAANDPSKPRDGLSAHAEVKRLEQRKPSLTVQAA